MAGLRGQEYVTYYTDQNFRQPQETEMINNDEALKICKRFIREFVSQDVYEYRQQLDQNVANGLYCLEVEIDDVQNFDTRLYQYLISKPTEIQPQFEEAIRQVKNFGVAPTDVPDFQLQLISQQNPKNLRDLKSNILNQLITVSGIIISVTKLNMKAKRLVVQCKNCKDIQSMDLGNGLSGEQIPRICKNGVSQVAGKEKCPMDPYVVIPEMCYFIDQEILRIQECSETIPTGEIPRNFTLCADRYLVNKMIPGQRVVVTGVYQVQHRGDDSIRGKNTNNKQLKIPYIHILGCQLASKRYATTGGQFVASQSQVQLFNEIARQDIFTRLQNSIAPAIFGHEDVKLALACLLFGGSPKCLPDGMKLRGDINILLVGDPSTAKSQLLKFIERVSDVAVYTSGKGSSAAGLTASITNQGQNQFSLEAGALVLASGGVCCIDEFDKMRPEDRVVMHEAMEQQTISIAKAGITTRLNAKCSVLAAANPIFGRYEESKSMTEQIELQTTILSRFDCIFIIKDKRTVENDRMMADHILDLHTGKFQEQELQGQMEEEPQQRDQLDIERLKAYIKYARSLPTPRLSNHASQMIENLYVQDRQKSEAQGHHKQHGGKSHIPITVRQLEAIIRLSEALAKMQLKKEVEEYHVIEAHRLFLNSTMMAVSLGAREFGLDLTADLRKLSSDIEESIKRRLPIGGKIPFQRLSDELLARFPNQRVVNFTINKLIQTEEMQQIDQKRFLIRRR